MLRAAAGATCPRLLKESCSVGCPTLSPMKLADALALPLGRAAFLTPDAEAQLVGPGGALASQLAALSDGVGEALRTLLEQRADLPPRPALPWTLLTEGEHPGWSLLALSDPPALPPAAGAWLAAHLAGARLVMPASQRRRAAGQVPQMAQAPTWSELLAERSAAQAAQALLGHWGVLSACVGLSGRHRPHAAALLQAELLGEHGAALTRPEPLAVAALWAVLWPLHGGLPRPGQDQVLHLTASLRSAPQRCGPLPTEGELADLLAASLPGLDAAQIETAARALHRGEAGDADPGSGVCLSCQPGAVAYWLRRRREVQLITCGGPAAAMSNRVWTWAEEGGKG